ncbi:Transmembrane protein 132E [Schistosoma japonicum]|nr:Transmembrane protein 132E [Schistosoma japonicum]
MHISANQQPLVPGICEKKFTSSARRVSQAIVTNRDCQQDPRACGRCTYTDDLVDITFRQRDSAFFISENQSLKYDSSTLFATASNSDRYEIDASLGLLRNSLTFLGDRLIRNSKLHVTVHTFDTEISEETKTLHVLCHASYYDKVNELKSESKSLCCVISVNASYFNELTSCVIVIDHLNKHWICHASMRLPPALWRQKQSPEVTLSYMFTEFASFSDNIKLHDVVHDNFKRCHLSLSDKKSPFTPLPSVSIAYLIPDATRDLGRSLLLQIPRRELKINENFFVTVRLKSFDDVSDFTLRYAALMLFDFFVLIMLKMLFEHLFTIILYQERFKFENPSLILI